MKRFLSILLTLALSLCLMAPAFGAETTTFTDMPASHWAHDYVERAVAAGMVNGTGDGRFSPDQTLTIAEFTAMVLRTIYGEERIAQYAKTESVNENGKWYAPYTAVANGVGLYENTIVYGLFAATSEEGKQAYFEFLGTGLDWEIDRYNMAVIMYNLGSSVETGLPYTTEDQEAAWDWAGDGAEKTVADWNEIPQKYRGSVAFCFQTGLLTGMDEAGTFQGSSTVNRAQAAVILCRLLDAKEQNGQAPAEPENKPEQPEEPKGPLMPNGQAMTEENVRAAIETLKNDYPEGMRWTNDNLYQSRALRTNGYGCAGFALLCSDTAFGDLPVSRKHSSFDDIRAGDMLRVRNNTHSVVVLEKKADSIIVAEGNYDSSIHWGREITREIMENDPQFYVETRYPADA